jgi:glycolate oxidase FAD binding subunit
VRHCALPVFAEPQLWRLSLPGAAGVLPLPPPRLVDWGGALRWYAGNGDCDYRGVAAAAGGTGLCWRGAAPQGRFHPLSSTSQQLHQRLKQRFDPRGIFNPNRLVRGL